MDTKSMKLMRELDKLNDLLDHAIVIEYWNEVLRLINRKNEILSQLKS